MTWEEFEKGANGPRVDEPLSPDGARQGILKLVTNPKIGRRKRHGSIASERPKKVAARVEENTILKTPLEKLLGFPVVTHTMVLNHLENRTKERVIPSRKALESTESGSVKHKLFAKAREYYRLHFDTFVANKNLFFENCFQELVSATNQYSFLPNQKRGIEIESNDFLTQVEKVFIKSIEVFPSRFVITEVPVAVPIRSMDDKIVAYYSKTSDMLHQRMDRIPVAERDRQKPFWGHAALGGVENKFTNAIYDDQRKKRDFFGMHLSQNIVLFGSEYGSGWPRVFVPNDDKPLGRFNLSFYNYELYAHVYPAETYTSEMIGYNMKTAKQEEQEFLEACKQILNIN